MRRRTTIVTGASRGIGRAIAEQLLRRGHRVIGVSRTEPSFSPDLETEAWSFVRFDLTPRDDLGREFAQALVGLEAADSIVLNAGIPAFGFLPQRSEREIRRELDLDLVSPILITRALLPRLQEQPAADLLFIGSESALTGRRRGAIYCAAKFGLRGFALALRDECATQGVRVTSIHPGMVRTGFFDGLDFAPGDAPENALDPVEIAATVTHVLESRPGVVFDEITMTPLKRVIRSTRDPE